MSASKALSLLLMILLSLCAVGCGDDDGDGDDLMGPGPGTGSDDPVTPNFAYVPPADRFNPADAPGFTNSQFVAMGEARSGVDGHAEAPITANIRYVSAATGDDANDGSEGAPWRSIQHAADVVSPGTTVYVDDSADYTGGLAISRSGSADQFIVFRSRPGSPAPRLVGGHNADAVVDIDASYICFMGFEIANHHRAGSDTDEIGIQIEPRSASISHVYIYNNWVHDIGPPSESGGTCYYNAHGIIAQSEDLRIANLIIDGNEMNDLYVGNSECLVINGNVEEFRVTNNYIHGVNNIAVDIIGYEKNNYETARRGLVADNVILDASNYWPYCTRGNCTYPAGDESSDGIYVDGGAEIVIEYNAVGRADHGIELQSENGQLIRDVEVRFNAVFNSNYRHFTLGPAQNSSEHDNVFFDDAALVDAGFEACR